MKKIALVLILFFIPLNLLAIEEVTSEKKKQDLAKIIRMSDYVCSSSNEANFMGETNRGLVFQVFCNNDSYIYRVILTPSDRFIVQPW